MEKGPPPPNAKKILVDIDKEEFKNHRIPKIDLKINANIKDYLIELNKKKLDIDKKKFTSWVNTTNKLKKKFPILSKKNFQNTKYVDPYYFFNQLSYFIKKDSVLIPDASANLIWAYQAFKVEKNINMFTAFNHSPMGYSLAASVGAYLGDKKKTITATIGDGSVPMNVQELETIKHYNVNVKIFVLNNKGYALIKQTQETWLNSRYAGVDKASGLSLPDNCKIAEAYGIKSIIIKNNKELNSKLQKVYKTKGPLLIDLRIDPKARVAPKIDFGKPLHDMSPSLPKKLIKDILENK